MLHNPDDYPSPDTFLPERFLLPDGSMNQNVRDPATVAFGFGRRYVPGVVSPCPPPAHTITRTELDSVRGDTLPNWPSS